MPHQKSLAPTFLSSPCPRSPLSLTHRTVLDVSFGLAQPTVSCWLHFGQLQRLALIVSEGAMRAAKRESNQQPYPAVNSVNHKDKHGNLWESCHMVVWFCSFRNRYLDYFSILKLDCLVCCYCFLMTYIIWISNHL